jgi:glutathione S-transferase
MADRPEFLTDIEYVTSGLADVYPVFVHRLAADPLEFGRAERVDRKLVEAFVVGRVEPHLAHPDLLHGDQVTAADDRIGPVDVPFADVDLSGISGQVALSRQF